VNPRAGIARPTQKYLLPKQRLIIVAAGLRISKDDFMLLPFDLAED
jgi:hypothetical protein